MNDWTTGIQRAVNYMEAHLTEDMRIEEIAAQAYASAFHFQRVFSVLCGFTVGEYIRNRRLTLAAQALVSGDVKVIDVALQYGYDSPDSFTRAFTRFHGVTPSQARVGGASLRSFAPVRVVLTLKGGSTLEYRIEEKPPFTLTGVIRSFSGDTSYQKIPKFWEEHMRSDHPICGAYGVCLDSDGRHFDYMIADNYIPWQSLPEGCQTRVIPGGLWAIFPCRGALPHALQDVNTRIWSEWVPSCREYRLAGNYNLEVYAPPAQNPDDNYSEIWIPIQKA